MLAIVYGSRSTIGSETETASLGHFRPWVSVSNIFKANTDIS